MALAGKTLRGSSERGSQPGMIPLVSAWATQNQIVLGQRKVPEQANEITALPALLRVFDLAGAVVSLDAMGCQAALAEQIVAQQGDDVLALKGHQGNRPQDVVQLFDPSRQQQLRGIAHDY